MSSIKGPHNRGRHEAIEGQIPTQNDLSTLTSIREQLSQYKTETKSTKEELRVQKKILQYTVDQIVNLRQAQEQLKSKRVAKGEGGAEPESWLLLKPTDENTSETVDTLLDISELRARKIELQKYCQSYHRQLHRLREERRELHLEIAQLKGTMVQLQRKMQSQKKAAENTEFARANIHSRRDEVSELDAVADLKALYQQHPVEGKGQRDTNSNGSQQHVEAVDSDHSSHFGENQEEVFDDDEDDSDISVASKPSDSMTQSEEVRDTFSQEEEPLYEDLTHNNELSSETPPEEKAFLQAQLRTAIPIKKSLKDKMLGKVYDSAQEEPKAYQEAWGRVQKESWAHMTGNVSPWCLSSTRERDVALSKYKQEVVGYDGPEYPDNSNVSAYTGSIDVHTLSHRVEEHLTKVWNQWVHDNVKGKNAETPSSLGTRHGWRR